MVKEAEQHCWSHSSGLWILCCRLRPFLVSALQASTGFHSHLPLDENAPCVQHCSPMFRRGQPAKLGALLDGLAAQPQVTMEQGRRRLDNESAMSRQQDYSSGPQAMASLRRGRTCARHIMHIAGKRVILPAEPTPPELRGSRLQPHSALPRKACLKPLNPLHDLVRLDVHAAERCPPAPAPVPHPSDTTIVKKRGFGPALEVLCRGIACQDHPRPLQKTGSHLQRKNPRHRSAFYNVRTNATRMLVF